MSVEAKLSFYKVHRCGYYEYGQHQPNFGSLSDTLNQLRTWAQPGKKPLVETCPFEVNPDSSTDNTFCFAIEGHTATDDYILTTWNQMPTFESGIRCVLGSDPVGKASVTISDVPKNSIPGYPTYFWFIPSLNAFATIRFDERANGHTNLLHFMKGFLTKCTSYVQWDKNEEAKIVGYSNAKDKDPYNLYPQFKSSLYQKAGQIEFLLSNCKRITKIKRKETLTWLDQPKRHIIKSIFQDLGVFDEDKPVQECKMIYEISHTPTREELKIIIETWQQDHEVKWEDIGFKLKKESSWCMLSRAFAKDTVEIEVSHDDVGIINAKSLLNAIVSKRTYLLDSLNSVESHNEIEDSED